MDEYVDILDENGNYTGKVLLKSEAHAKGLFHPTIHVWLYTTDGKVLLQKRSACKDTFPGYWDVSVAGHIGAGEASLSSALREVEEELGLQLSEKALEKTGICKSVTKHREDLIDCEFHHIYIGELNVPLSELKLQETEVDDVKLMDIDEFLSIVKDPPPSSLYVISCPDYYKSVFGAINKKLKQD
ncbi:NUDIX hydrolase [Sinomicrobium weinanense]|uniref:NUDIX domain-containing protein n=1 Tax=Sinomicrobium weinanense TaxID=2842200 RepID=A0A926JRJ6_9FLAO|nr:NUDIX domain-containing protein [Sinomicrobium weinanense]MBC9796069.1 NUDIX domain-containing protein [Sinomicrobium weinanense]MBU3124738.1 NUDIX domain-containing protein [Sinomicrobium weinanense]